jgi:hypothetical protein
MKTVKVLLLRKIFVVSTYLCIINITRHIDSVMIICHELKRKNILYYITQFSIQRPWHYIFDIYIVYIYKCLVKRYTIIYIGI